MIRSPSVAHCFVSTALTLAVLLAAPVARAHSPHDVIEQIAVTAGPGDQQIVFAKLHLTSKSLLGRSFDSGASWSVTALPVAERDISRIALSPAFASDGGVLLATTDIGVLLSHDQGGTWQHLDGIDLDPRVLDAAFSLAYATDTTLYAATATGVYVSHDDGASWTQHTTGLASNVVTRLARVPGDASQLFCGRRTLHHSTDGGSTWLPLHTFASDMSSISVSPRYFVDQTLVVGLKSGGGVFYSTNAGLTWNPMVAGLSDPFVNDVVMGSDGTVFAVTEEAGCFRAPLGGTFTLSDAGFEGKSDLTTNHYRVVALGPGWPAKQRVWVGSFEGLFQSEDGGGMFFQKDIYSQGYNRQIAFPPDYASSRRAFFVNYGGGLIVTPAGVPSGGSVGPLAGGPTLGGSQAFGSPHGTGGGPNGSAPSRVAAPAGSSGGPVHYETRSDGVLSLFGQSLAFSPGFAQDGTLYYAQGTIYRSDDQGLSWTKLTNPPGVSVVRALTLAPTFPSDPTLWLGAGLGAPAYRSPDGGQSWIAMGNGLVAVPQPVEILPSPGYASDQTVYLASKTDGVFRSTDGGASWAHADAGLLDLHVEAFCMSPDYVADGTLFAGIKEFGLFRSTDQGTSWQPANASLPTDLPLSVERVSLSPDFDSDGTGFVVILAAGVFKTTDGGDSWQPVGPGLPAAAPRVVAVSPDFGADQTVLVSTYAWTYASHDGGASFHRLPGYARFDDLNPHLHYELAAGTDHQDSAGDPAQRPPVDDDLVAWLLDGACPGLGLTIQEANDLGLSWPAVSWPEGNHGASVTEGALAGDTLTLDMYGNSVRWFAPRAPDQGIARITIDDRVVALIDLYAPVATATVPVFSQAFDGVGAHRVSVVVTGQKSAMSSGTLVRNDGFDVTY